MLCNGPIYARGLVAAAAAAAASDRVDRHLREERLQVTLSAGLWVSRSLGQGECAQASRGDNR